MVEGARLESVCRGNSTEGSNPSLSAIRLRSPLGCSGELRRDGSDARERSRRSAEREGGRIPLSPPIHFHRYSSAFPKNHRDSYSLCLFFLSRVLSRSVVREAIKLIEADGWREVTTKGSVSR